MTIEFMEVFERASEDSLIDFKKNLKNYVLEASEKVSNANHENFFDNRYGSCHDYINELIKNAFWNIEDSEKLYIHMVILGVYIDFIKNHNLVRHGKWRVYHHMPEVADFKTLYRSTLSDEVIVLRLRDIFQMVLYCHSKHGRNKYLTGIINTYASVRFSNLEQQIKSHYHDSENVMTPIEGGKTQHWLHLIMMLTVYYEPEDIVSILVEKTYYGRDENSRLTGYMLQFCSTIFPLIEYTNDIIEVRK